MAIRKLANDDWVTTGKETPADFLEQWYGYLGGDDIDHLDSLASELPSTIQFMERDQFPPELINAFKVIVEQINLIDGMTGFR